MPLPLPPLNALRAFEAAARSGSYVAAAAELGVTAAAISQQVRKLEAHLGKDMFLRSHNGLRLTDAGQSMFTGASAALQALSETTTQLRTDRARSRLVISTIDSVAEKWLLPRLAAFAFAHPDTRFDLRVEPDPVDFSRFNIDLRVAYGAGHYPDLVTTLLAQDQVQPMCSPAYLTANPQVEAQGMAAVPPRDLIHSAWGPSFGTNPTWRGWYQAADLPPPDSNAGFQVGRSSLAVDLARAGLGVALAQRMLATPDLERGDLLCLSQITLPLGHPYALVSPPAKAAKREVTALRHWLGAADWEAPVA